MDEPPIHEWPAFPCPHCGKTVGTSVNADDGTQPPVAGDIGVCQGCAEVWIFGEDLRGRKPTAREIFELIRSGGWESVLEAQRVVLRTRRRNFGCNDN